MKALTLIMGYLFPFPDRHRCSAVCRHWKFAATDIRFVIHVYPVEMGALANKDPSKRHYNHFANIEDALVTALPGDTIGESKVFNSSRTLVSSISLHFTGSQFEFIFFFVH